MILKRFYDEPLAHASYLVGCPGVGEAVVIDPNRDLDPYLEAAAAEGLRITGVTETHIHADYASGSLELAERTGATLYLSDEGGADWKYVFADRPFVRLVKDGDSFGVGRLRFDVVHTPGHTPEHIALVLTDEAASREPCCAFTGDFLFVGDVGRPDLLERAAGFTGTMEDGARVLFRSIQKFKQYPDCLMIWPAHGAGSPCGKSLGGVPATTLGYELKTNWALKAVSNENFVREVLEGQPDPPLYYKEMKRLNKAGAPPVGSLGAPSRLGGKAFLDLLDREEIVVDIRSTAEVNAGAAVGALHIPLGKGFTIWAGWLLSYDRPIYLLASNAQDAAKAKRNLATIGLDDVRGWFGPDALNAYAQKHGALVTTPQVRAEELIDGHALGEVAVLDVRNVRETAAGTVPGAIGIPLGRLQERLNEVPKDLPLVVYCASGVRSTVAISILRRSGFRSVRNLIGGYGAFERISASRLTGASSL